MAAIYWRRRIVALVIIVLSLAAIFWGLVLLISRILEADDVVSVVVESTIEPESPTLILDGFKAGHLIDDDVFYDSDAMSLEEINDFLLKVGAGCISGPEGTPCLVDYQEETASFAADRFCPGAFQGDAADTAAQIIYKAAQACGINPQVLLVTLQKEQSLLTASSQRLTPRRYEIAMGYGCPDGIACDEQYYGLANQVYGAARQFQRYRLEPHRFDFEGGLVSEVRFHPDRACGSSEVEIVNDATAALYNYTPFQPDEMALSGVRGDCSSVGNRNFYGLFQAWFGSPRGD